MNGPTLIAAAEERFGPAVRIQPSPNGWDTDLHLYVALDDGDSLTVSHFADNTSISFEADDATVRETVAWYRSLLPADFPPLVACDEAWNGHVDLTPTVTTTETTHRWVDHSTRSRAGTQGTPSSDEPAPHDHEERARHGRRWCGGVTSRASDGMCPSRATG